MTLLQLFQYLRNLSSPHLPISFPLLSSTKSRWLLPGTYPYFLTLISLSTKFTDYTHQKPLFTSPLEHAGSWISDNTKEFKTMLIWGPEQAIKYTSGYALWTQAAKIAYRLFRLSTPPFFGRSIQRGCSLLNVVVVGCFNETISSWTTYIIKEDNCF